MLGWELPPHHSGGLGVACYEMCKHLADSGVDIDFVLPYTTEHRTSFMNIIPADNQTIDDFKWSGGVYDLKSFPSQDSDCTVDMPLDLTKQHDLYAHNIVKIAKCGEFDIIHAHDWLTFKAAIVAKRISGKPLIVHIHSTQFDQSAGKKGNPAVGEIEIVGLKMADRIFAVSQYTKDVLVREYAVPKQKIKVVHNSVNMQIDIPRNKNLYEYLSIMKSNGYKVVVSVGRMTIQKGLTHLIKAAYRVISIDSKVLFLLAGGGEQKEELIRLTASLGISRNVIFEDWVKGDALKDTFKIGDVFVLPSVSEPFGLTALESLNYGTPVIISKQSGVSEVLDNCFKVDYWDIDLLSEMILGVVNHSSLAKEMLKNSRRECENQSWYKTARNMKNNYEEMLGVT